MIDRKTGLGIGLGGAAILGAALYFALGPGGATSESNPHSTHQAMGHQSVHSPLHGQGHAHEMPINSELEYIAGMIPHHQEAVDSAQFILVNSQRPEMRTFAETIIEVQTAEIEELQGWLRQWYPHGEGSVFYTPMMRDLSKLSGDALDQAFLEDMIIHHEGAVSMSQELLTKKLAHHRPVEVFAVGVVTTQASEIKQMQAWLQEWFQGANVQQSTPHHHH